MTSDSRPHVHARALWGLLFLLIAPHTLADCWNLQHPDDPQPSTLDPIPSGWARPSWSHLAPTMSPPPPLPVPVRVCNVQSYGAWGGDDNIDTEAIAAAIADCAKQGGGSVRLPAPGIYLSGPLDLSCPACTSTLSMEIQAGAVLRSAVSMQKWPVTSTYPDHAVNATAKPQYTPFISAKDSRGIALVGGGAIELNGHDWWVLKCNKKPFPDKTAQRPFAIRFDNCSDVHVESISILNPPFWTLVPTHCSHVVIHNVSIVAPAWSPNTDGFEPMTSKDVRVSGCFVQNGDDCMTVKSGCSGVVAADNYFMTGHGATIGSVTDLDVENITFRNILLNATTNALQVKGRVGSKAAAVRNVLYDGIRFVNLSQYHDTHHDPAMAVRVEMLYGGGRVDPMGVHIENFTLRNFSGDSTAAGVFHCRQENPCRGLVMEGVHVNTTGNISGWTVTAAFGKADDVIPRIDLSPGADVTQFSV